METVSRQLKELYSSESYDVMYQLLEEITIYQLNLEKKII